MENEVQTAQVSKSITPFEGFRSQLSGMSDQFKAALPPHVTPERFVRVVMTAVQGNQDLLNADRKSLWGSCMKAAQDGLLPDGRESALVIYRTKNGPMVQYIPMVGGILKKIRNSGELATLATRIIYEKDEFQYWVDGEGEHLTHRPQLFGERGKRIGVYAIATTKDGFRYFEIMNMAEVNDVKNVSRSKDGGPWSGPFEGEMIKKTVLRRLSKRLPMSTDLEQVISRDDELYDLSAPTTPAPAKIQIKTVQEALSQELPVTEDEIPEFESPSKDPADLKKMMAKTEPETKSEPKSEPEQPATAPINEEEVLNAMSRKELSVLIRSEMVRVGWTTEQYAEYAQAAFQRKPNELVTGQMVDSLMTLRALETKS